MLLLGSAHFPPADGALLTEWYVEWYHTLPVEGRLPFFRTLATVDNKPRTVPYYDKEMLVALVQPFEQLKASWLFHFALDHISNGNEFSAMYSSLEAVKGSTLDLKDYRDAVALGGSAEEIFYRLEQLDKDRVTSIFASAGPASKFEKRRDATVDAYCAAGDYWGKAPRKKLPIIEHPDVASWLKRIPDEEVKLVLAVSKPQLWKYSSGHLKFLVDLARRDTDPAKRIPLCAMDSGHDDLCSWPELATKVTVLGQLSLSHGTGPVYVQFVLDYISTPDELERIRYDGKSLDFSHLDMTDYATVRKGAVKKGHGATEVLASLRRRQTTNENKSLGFFHKKPGAAYQSNKKYILDWECRELAARYTL